MLTESSYGQNTITLYSNLLQWATCIDTVTREMDNMMTTTGGWQRSIPGVLLSLYLQPEHHIQ